MVQERLELSACELEDLSDLKSFEYLISVDEKITHKVTKLHTRAIESDPDAILSLNYLRRYNTAMSNLRKGVNPQERADFDRYAHEMLDDLITIIGNMIPEDHERIDKILTSREQMYRADDSSAQLGITGQDL